MGFLQSREGSSLKSSGTFECSWTLPVGWFRRSARSNRQPFQASRHVEIEAAAHAHSPALSPALVPVRPVTARTARTKTRSTTAISAVLPMPSMPSMPSIPPMPPMPSRYSKSTKPTVSPTQATTPTRPRLPTKLSRANITSTTMSQSSSLSLCLSPSFTSYATTASPTSSACSTSALARTPSVYSDYSHRSMSIQRDSLHGPSILPKSKDTSFYGVPLLPMSEHNSTSSTVVLTSTSRYPTGIAAELYIPEDCTYQTAMERERESHRNDRRCSLKKNVSLVRRHSGFGPAQDGQRLKRLSINF